MALRTEPVSWDAIESAIQTAIVTSSGIPGTNVIFAQQGGKRPTGQFISLNINNISEEGIDWTDWKKNNFTFADLTIADVSGSTLHIPAHGLLTGDGPIQLKWPAPPTGLVNNGLYWAVVIDTDHVQLAKNYLDSVHPWDNSAPIPITLSSAGIGTGTIVSTPDTEHKGQGLIAKTRGVWKVTMSIQCFAGDSVGSTDPAAVLMKVMLKFRTMPIINALNAAGIGVSDFTPVKAIGKAISMTIFEPRATMDFKFFLAAQIEDYQTYIARVQYQNLNSGITTTVERPES